MIGLFLVPFSIFEVVFSGITQGYFHPIGPTCRKEATNIKVDVEKGKELVGTSTHVDISTCRRTQAKLECLQKITQGKTLGQY